jgi:ATP-dependent Clp protease ATP-binding subunit ClpC
LRLAEKAAKRLQVHLVDTEHLLIGLVQDEGIAGQILRQAGLDYWKTLHAIEKKPRKDEPDSGKVVGVSPGIKIVLELAVLEARLRDQSKIGTGHLLMGLIRYREGVALEVLVSLGIKPRKMRKRLRQALIEAIQSET